MRYKHPEYIEGDRIRLRPAVMSDRHQIYEALAQSELTDILIGHPSWNYTTFLSYDEFCCDYKEYYFNDSHPELGRCFVIEVDGSAAGQVNYNDIEPGKNRTELDIWMFSEKMCGHGYGTEALRLLCDYLKNECGVEGFYIKPSAANPRAVRAYEKAGFFKTGLSFEEAQKAYGPPDDFDSIYMTRNIENPEE